LNLKGKWVLVSAILIFLSFFLTAYTLAAYSIATSYIIEEDDETYWRTSPTGSLAPWPRKPGTLQALSKVSESDLYIYNHLIKFPTLPIITTLVWIITGVCILKAADRLHSRP